MGDLGQRLKREREARGVSLNEIAQRTRIGVRLLKAIEEEEFDQLPGGIFNRSFIQQYAQYLGVDEKEAVRDYLRALAAAREIQYPQPTPQSGMSVFATSKVLLRLSLGTVAIVLIALIARLIIPRSESPGESQIAAVNSPAAPTSATAPRVGDSEAVVPPNAPGSSTSGIRAAEGVDTVGGAADPGPEPALPRREASAPPSPADLLRHTGDREPLAGELPEELLLQINARSTVWISITADGEDEWEGTLQANQSREVQAADTIRLTVGNAGGVELTLNGKDLGSLGGEGEVKTVTLAARALQEVIP